MAGLTARTSDGFELQLGERQPDVPRAAQNGPLLRAGDPGCDEARSIWNAMIDRRPALVARCVGMAPAAG